MTRSTGPGVLDEEYRLLRHEVAAAPVQRQAVLVEGPDASSYLQGQCSQDVVSLAAGASADALLLSPQGKLDALVRVTRSGPERFVVDVDAGFADVVVARLQRFRLRVKVAIELLPWHCVALRGPAAAAAAAPGSEVGGGGIAIAFDWNGVTGVDLLGPGPVVPSDVPVAGPEAWSAVRVEAGIPLMGAELDDRTIAAEADLLDRAVSFTKGCYTGQELVARLDARGNRVARRLRGLVLPDVEDPGGATGGDRSPGGDQRGPRPGDGVAVDGRDVGRVTSVAWSPVLGCAVALAYVHRSVEPPAAAAVCPPADQAVAALAPDAAVAGSGAVAPDAAVAGSGAVARDAAVARGAAVAGDGTGGGTPGQRAEVRALPLVGPG